MFERGSQDALPRVLLIDDDLVSREVAATVLTMNGYTVHTAEDGAKSLTLFAANEGGQQTFEPDVILMDSQMPGLSGTQLIAQLRARSQAPIYVVSGSDAPPDVIDAADGFLLKPFNAESFRKLLKGVKAESATSLVNGNEPAANEPVVNTEILAQFRKLMPEPAVRQVYQAVVADLGRRIDALGSAMAKGDAAEVRRIGHAIKGGCGMAGAVQAARLGALLESGDNHLDNSAMLLRDLRTAARRLQNMLESELPA
jgi:CheY-like chemotaxis protein